MVDAPGRGRTFEARDRVRTSDVDPQGQMRLDAVVRLTQNLSNDDTNDVGLRDDLAWIARSTVVDVIVPATVDEALTLSTFCAGLGRTWAQRRIVVTGAKGARYEVATLWVSIEPETVRPRRLSEQFLEIYGSAAGDRKVSAKQRISRPTDELVHSGRRLRWEPRLADFDAFGHMNNLIYWIALQEAHGKTVGAGHRVLIEHGAGVTPDVGHHVVIDDAGEGLRMWWLPLSASGEPSNQYLAAAQLASL